MFRTCSHNVERTTHTRPITLAKAAAGTAVRPLRSKGALLALVMGLIYLRTKTNENRPKQILSSANECRSTVIGQIGFPQSLKAYR